MRKFIWFVSFEDRHGLMSFDDGVSDEKVFDEICKYVWNMVKADIEIKEVNKDQLTAELGTEILELDRSITNRGFAVTKFKDYYGANCSLQKSSIADKDCIWLGVDDPNPKKMIKGRGWVNAPIAPDIMLSTRMHLTRNQARQLVEELQYFVDTGEVKRDSEVNADERA